MNKKEEFHPLFKSSYYQTVISNFFDFSGEPPSKTHFVKLSDGDIMSIEVSTPKGWKEEDGTVALLHGLCGSSKSPYLKRIAKRVYAKKKQVIRINMRGCGIGKGLAKNIYHSGSSKDIEDCLEDIKKHIPRAAIVLIGFSLGANVTIKLAGELGKKNSPLLKAVFAVSPPLNLLTSAHRFSLEKNKVYANYFSKQLFMHIENLHKLFPDLPPHKITTKTTLNDIDELYIAKRANFSSALDYYKHCSGIKVIKDITIPTKILFAKDDPIIDSHQVDDIKLPENIEIIKTEYGGHLGYVGKNVFKEFRWMDNFVENWIENIFNKKVN